MFPSLSPISIHFLMNIHLFCMNISPAFWDAPTKFMSFLKSFPLFPVFLSVPLLTELQFRLYTLYNALRCKQDKMKRRF